MARGMTGVEVNEVAGFAENGRRQPANLRVCP